MAEQEVMPLAPSLVASQEAASQKTASKETLVQRGKKGPKNVSRSLEDDIQKAASQDTSAPSRSGTKISGGASSGVTFDVDDPKGKQAVSEKSSTYSSLKSGSMTDEEPEAESAEEESELIEGEGEEETEVEEETEELDNIEDYLEHLIEEEEEEEVFVSVFERLDVERELMEPQEITEKILKRISVHLGQIRLCWPKKQNVNYDFMKNVILPDGYFMNTNKEKVLLIYCENFRQQYHQRFPNRKPLLFTADNIVEQRKMVCTTLRPTTVTYPNLSTWQEIASFVADHIQYEPLNPPTCLVSDFNNYFKGVAQHFAAQ